MSGLSKRERLARIAARSGVTAMLERWPRSRGVVIVNYHRIAEPEGCEYDWGVIDSTPAQFERHVRWMQSRFPMLTLSDVVRWAEDPTSLKRGGVLITFDDGYRDNYEVAFPILKRLGVPAAFFLPSTFIGASFIPWWDRIANVLRRTRRPEIQMAFPVPAAIRVAGNLDSAVRQVIELYKLPAMDNPDRFFTVLAEACDCECPAESASPLFMTWADAREMARAGMGFGSHTHRHEILAKMPAADQYRELVVSRQEIESRLDVPIDALAYPVGSRSAFSDETREALRQAGYRVAFSYYGGVNSPSAFDRYNLLRTSVERTVSFDLFRLRVALGASATLNI